MIETVLYLLCLLAAPYVGDAIAQWQRRRRALVRDAKDDLRALNDPGIFHTPMSVTPPVTTLSQRYGVFPVCAESKPINVPLHRRSIRAMWEEFKKTLSARWSPMVTAKGVDMILYQRRSHKAFCAKWARAAKARFEFARVCDDSALNRAALHRWFLQEWKQLRNARGEPMPLPVLDLVMTGAIDMAFLPAEEFMNSESKKVVKKRARMEFYNERKFVEGWTA